MWMHRRCCCCAFGWRIIPLPRRHADVPETSNARARKRCHCVMSVANQVINTTNTTTVNVFLGDGQAMAIPAGTEKIHRIHAENIGQFGTQPFTRPLDPSLPLLTSPQVTRALFSVGRHDRRSYDAFFPPALLTFSSQKSLFPQPPAPTLFTHLSTSNTPE